MAFGNQGQVGFNNPAEIVVNKVLIVGANGELLVYNPSKAAGNLIASISGHQTVDQFLDTVLQGIASYSSTSFSQLNGGNVEIGSLGKAGLPSTLFDNNTAANGSLAIDSGKSALTDTSVTIELNGNPTPTNAAVIIATNNAGRQTIGNILEVQGTEALVESAAGNLALIVLVTGDTNNRFQVDSNGKMQWGPGNAAVDVDLYRGFAGALQTDSLLRIENNILQIQASAAGNTTAQEFIVTDTVPRWQMTVDGKMQWGPGGSGSLDTDLYRDAGGGRLDTDGAFLAIASILTEAGFIVLQAPSANNALAIQAIGAANPSYTLECNGTQNWGPGGATAVDTTLYRSSAGVLGVDTLLRNVSGAIEVWHSLGTLAVTGVTTIVGRYRLLPDGDVEIDVGFSTAAAVATFSQNFPNTLPAAYQPLNPKQCAIAATGAAWTISGSRLPNLLVSGANVQVNMPAIPGAIGNFGCTFRYPVN